MHPLRLFTRCCALTFIAVLLGGCAGIPLNPPSGTIGGIAASKSKVVLAHQQEIRAAVNVTYIYPAGDYRPVYEDPTGVYYEAPSKVIMKENFLGINLPGKPFDGGIFLERANPKVGKIYGVTPANQGGEIQRLLKGGRPGKPLVPRQPVQFQLTRS